jgi:hypothetical protein
MVTHMNRMSGGGVAWLLVPSSIGLQSLRAGTGLTWVVALVPSVRQFWRTVIHT